VSLTFDSLPENRTYIFGRAHNIVDERTHFKDGLKRYINGAKCGVASANVLLGNWCKTKQAFSVKIKKRRPSTTKGHNYCKTTTFAIQKGQEFILAYSSGY
jgi:hypothetical protein